MVSGSVSHGSISLVYCSPEKCLVIPLWFFVCPVVRFFWSQMEDYSLVHCMHTRGISEENLLFSFLDQTLSQLRPSYIICPLQLWILWNINIDKEKLEERMGWKEESFQSRKWGGGALESNLHLTAHGDQDLPFFHLGCTSHHHHHHHQIIISSYSYTPFDAFM